MSLFPMFVKLEWPTGAWWSAPEPWARAKIESLLAAGASVHVVAPQATPRVREWAREGRIEWERARIRAGGFCRCVSGDRRDGIARAAR